MLIIKLLFIVFLALAMLSFVKIRRHKSLIQFIYTWAFPMGSFVWEDLFVFSVYGVIATLTSWYFGQVKLALLFLVVFWLVRSAGETLYYFLQQFIRPKHYPHNVMEELKLIHKLFGPISDQQAFILMQVFLQVITMISMVVLIVLLMNWTLLP